MSNLLLFLILSISFSYAGPREEAEDILNRFQNETSIVNRLDAISRIFVGHPYGKGGPLGEGPDGKFDQDPLYRFDTFDCTTYVETIMALALSRSAEEFEAIQDQIRYEDGTVDYFKRKHFTDLQWIPLNIQDGFLSEITYRIFDRRHIKIAEANVDFGGWLRAHKLEQIKVPYSSSEERLSLLEELKSHSRFYSPQIARVPYIEISRLVAGPRILNNIPSGSVVNFVRPNWDLTEVAGTHQNISHQGFLFKKDKILFLRHASTSGKVEELPFVEYLKRFRDHPTLKGVHFMKVLER